MSFQPEQQNIDETMTVLLTCVCYNDVENVRQFIKHLQTSVVLPVNCRLRIALADNSHSLDTTASFASNVTIYRPEGNLGYLGGCAFAFREWVEQFGVLPQWTGILNTDIQFDADFFQRLAATEIPAEIAIIAPDIRLPDGTMQNPFMRERPSRLRMMNYITSRRLFLAFPLLKTIHRAAFCVKRALMSRKNETANRREDVAMPGLEQIYAPHGSAIFLRDSFFKSGGSLEYDSFLYMEEIHLAVQARKVGLQTAWMPALKIAHYENTVTSKISQRRRLRWEYQSAKVVYRTYFCERH